MNTFATRAPSSSSTPAWIAPSVAWEVPLDLSPDAGPRLTPQNPAFMVHVHTPGAPLVSHAAFLSGLF